MNIYNIYLRFFCLIYGIIAAVCYIICMWSYNISKHLVDRITTLFIITNIMISFLTYQTLDVTSNTINHINIFFSRILSNFPYMVAVLFFCVLSIPILREANFGFTLFYIYWHYQLVITMDYFLMEMWAINVLCLHHFRLIWLFEIYHTKLDN
jgi:hypothetical protein